MLYVFFYSDVLDAYLQRAKITGEDKADENFYVKRGKDEDDESSDDG